MNDAAAPQPGFPSAQDVDAALRAAFGSAAAELAVTDDSHLHAGHSGAQAGRHFSVRLVSSRFDSLARVARHRLVYDALAAWMPHGIHALALSTLTPDEARQGQASQPHDHGA